MRTRLTLKQEITSIVDTGEGPGNRGLKRAGQGTVMGLGKTAGSLSTRDSSCGKLPFGEAY